MKKVVVFGGSGFLGSHVCDKLSEAGYGVTIFDRIRSPYCRRDQHMIVGDLLDEKKVEKTVQGSDFAFNFAGIADIEEAAKKPVDTVRTNIMGNTIALEASRKAGIERFFFSSSIYVHGQSGGFYRASKQACEKYIEVYHDIHDLHYTILRFGSLYGPRSDERNAIHRFVKNALQYNRIPYDGDPNAQREYIHVEDAARACVDLLAAEFANRHIVLTGSQTIRVLDLLKMIQEMSPGDVEIAERSVAARSMHYTLTSHKFSPKLGKKYFPALQTDLNQGLLQQIESIYRNLHSNAQRIDDLWVAPDEGR